MHPLAPSLVARHCAREATPRSPCDACRRACPRNAILLSPGVTVTDSCDGCGACVVACPGGALVSPADEGAARPERLPRNQATVVVACDRTDHEVADLLLPCLAAVPLHLAPALAARGCGGLELRSGDCETCHRAPAAREIPGAVHRTLSWLRVTGRSLEVRRTVRPGGRASDQGVSRRGFFTMLGSRWRSGGIGDPGLRIPGPRGDLLDTLSAAATGDWTTGDPEAVFHDLQIAPSCNGCRVCQEVCAMGALRREEVGDRVEIHFHPFRCTGCGNCQACCLPHAVRLVPLPARELAHRGGGFPDSREALNRWESRAVLRWHPCSECGVPVLGPEGVPCIDCRTSRARGWTV